METLKEKVMMYQLYREVKLQNSSGNMLFVKKQQILTLHLSSLKKMSMSNMDCFIVWKMMK